MNNCPTNQADFDNYDVPTTSRRLNGENMRYKDIYVDPPSGWNYGFPKIKKADDERDMKTWLVENGYPLGMIGLNTLDYLVCWDVTEENDNE